MQAFNRVVFVILILLLPFTILAHGYWFEATGNHQAKSPVTIKLFFGEYVKAEKLSGKTLDKLKDIHVFVILPGNNRVAIEMTQFDTHWEGNYIPADNGTYTIIGINDTREVQDWTKHNLGIVRPIQYLKQTYQVGAITSAISPVAFLDITATGTSAGNYALQIVNKKSLPDSIYVTVTTPGGEEDEIEIDATGKGNFKTTASGLYLISAEWIDKQPGDFKGKAYLTVRHRLDYTVYHP